MIERAVFRGRVHHGEAAAMKQLGKEIAGLNVGQRHVGPGGEPIHLLVVLRRDIFPLQLDQAYRQAVGLRGQRAEVSDWPARMPKMLWMFSRTDCFNSAPCW